MRNLLSVGALKRRRNFVLLWTSVLLSACAIAPRQSALMKRVGASEMSVSELRAQVRSLAPRFSGEIEALAEHISDASEDPKVHLFMAQFRMNALPQLQLALFQPAPVAALIDAWALIWQLQGVVAPEQPTTRRLSGSALELAQSQFKSMDAELAQLWRKLTGKEDVSAVSTVIRKWAEQNPIEASLAARKSTAGLFAEITTGEGIGFSGAAGQLLETTQDLATRVDLLTAFGPKQFRWQIEYLLRDLITDPTIFGSLRADSEGLLSSLQKVTQSVGALPALISSEREAVLQTFHDERLETQDFLQGERQAFTEDLRQERIAATADINRLGLSWIDHAFDRATALAERLFLFTLLLVAILVLGAVLIAQLSFRAWERRRLPPATGRRAPSPPLEA